jgi:hypothetical protein
LITLRYSTYNSVSCQVYKDSQIIGRVRVAKGMTCNKYLAIIHGRGQEDCSTKEFDTLSDALYWLEKSEGMSKSS